MVATAGSGGLSSSMNIKGTLDTSLIERGFMRVKQGFASVKGFAKGFTSDLISMKQAAAGLSKKLFSLAIIGSSALVGLASKAPAVAGSMAKMGVAIGKIQRALGEGLAPAFEKVSMWLDKLAVWASSNPNIFAGIVGSLAIIAALKFTGVLGFLSAMASTVVGATVLTALAALVAISAVGFAGAKIGETITERTRDFLTEQTAQIPGSLESLRDIDISAAEIAAQGFQPTPGGAIYEGEPRRAFFLQWWDAMWG